LLYISVKKDGKFNSEADQYTDSPEGRSIPNAGWAGNMMASYNGTVDQRNINGIVEAAVKNLNSSKSSAENHNSLIDLLRGDDGRFVIL
jgi:hypothetical protein